MYVRELNESDAVAFTRVRLRGLVECPLAFAASAEEEQGFTTAEVEARLKPDARGFVHGAFDGAKLCGIVGWYREREVKLSHKGWIWGMYVAPEKRGQGVGTKLLESALDRAASVSGLQRILLGVGANNSAALKLYSAAGFVEFGREPGYMLVAGELHDEIYMMLELVRKSGRRNAGMQRY